MENGSCIGPKVDCYNVDTVHLKENSLVSQKTYLCTASHDIVGSGFKLITAPIIIEKKAWVAADAFVGMGVTIGENSVVGARSSVFKDVPPNVIVGGNPAKIIRNR
jgi:putative colanic acid biosynthesis acetyltransferase WcaF